MLTQTEFVQWIAYAQADKVQTAASVRMAMEICATEEQLDVDVEAAAREYEATYGVHTPGLAAA